MLLSNGVSNKGNKNDHVRLKSTTLAKLMSGKRESEMSRAVILNRCSLILAPIGSQLFLQSKCAKTIRVVLRIWFLCVLPMFIERSISLFRDDGITIQLLLLVSLVAGMFASNGLLIFRRVKLECLISRLAAHIKEDEARVLIRRLNFAFALFFLQMIFFVGTEINITLAIQEYSVSSSLQRFYEFMCGYASYWIMVSCIFYWTIMQILFLFSELQVNSLMKQVSNTDKDAMMVSKVVRSITGSFEEFEQLLSLLPLLWFMFGIVSSAETVYGIMMNPEDYITAIFSLQDYLPPLIVVAAADHMVGKVHKMSDDACNKMHMSERIGEGEKDLLLRELDILKKLKLTGMHCFTLDLKLILVYVGAVFSYAALIAAFVKKSKRINNLTSDNFSDSR